MDRLPREGGWNVRTPAKRQVELIEGLRQSVTARPAENPRESVHYGACEPELPPPRVSSCSPPS
jgi:hypothetical protein